jgi:hypothetical protein
VSGYGFAGGTPVELHWNAMDGTLLGTTTGPSFDAPVTIPGDAAPDTYQIVAIQKGTGNAASTQAAAPFTVQRADSAANQAPGAPDSWSSQPPPSGNTSGATSSQSGSTGFSGSGSPAHSSAGSSASGGSSSGAASAGAPRTLVVNNGAGASGTIYGGSVDPASVVSAAGAAPGVPGVAGAAPAGVGAASAAGTLGASTSNLLRDVHHDVWGDSKGAGLDLAPVSAGSQVSLGAILLVAGAVALVAAFGVLQVRRRLIAYDPY